MSNTITAMFDSRAEAEAAKDRLKAANVDADNIHVHDKSSAGYKEEGYSTHQDRGMWESIKTRSCLMKIAMPMRKAFVAVAPS